MKKFRAYKITSVILALMLLVSCYPRGAGFTGSDMTESGNYGAVISSGASTEDTSSMPEAQDKKPQSDTSSTSKKPGINRPTSSKETEKDDTSSHSPNTSSTVPGTHYLIAYDANGAAGTMKSTKAAFGEDIRLAQNAFVWDGHEFIGWNLKRNYDDKWLYYNSTSAKVNWHSEGYQPEFWLKRLFNDSDLISFKEDEVGPLVTLYAQWRECCQIVYDANGGSGTMKETLVYDQPTATISNNTFSKSGYTFSGWQAYSATLDKWAYSSAGGGIVWEDENTQPQGLKKHVFAEGDKIAISGDMTCSKIILYAVWTAK